MGGIREADEAVIISEARVWLGTRFVHQGRGACSASAPSSPLQTNTNGVDCLGLLMAVAHALNLRARDGSLLYTHDRTDYPRLPDGAAMETQLDALLWRVSPDTPFMPAQVALFTLAGNPQHLGLLTNYHSGEYGIIHAYAPLRRVVEHRLDAQWQRRLRARFSLFDPLAPQNAARHKPVDH